MRAITAGARNCFNLGRPYIKGNTCVALHKGKVMLILHGHVIAWKYEDEPNKLRVSMCGHPTVITRERLNAILPSGFSVKQVKGEQYLTKNGIQYPMDVNKEYEVYF